MRSYGPEELFDGQGALVPELRELLPAGECRMSANPHANGGKLRKALNVQDFWDYGIPIDDPATKKASPTETLGNSTGCDAPQHDDLPTLQPDENASNRLQDVYEATLKTWLATIKPDDADGTDIAPDGLVMETLTEHTLEGYILTGRHGLFTTYEAFVRIIDSGCRQQ